MNSETLTEAFRHYQTLYGLHDPSAFHATPLEINLRRLGALARVVENQTPAAPDYSTRLENLRLLSQVYSEISHRGGDAGGLERVLRIWIQELQTHPISTETLIEDYSQIARLAREHGLEELIQGELNDAVQAQVDQWRNPSPQPSPQRGEGADRQSIQNHHLAFQLLLRTHEAMGEGIRELLQDVLGELDQDVLEMERSWEAAPGSAQIQTLGEVAAIYRMLMEHPEAGEYYAERFRITLDTIVEIAHPPRNRRGREEGIDIEVRLQVLLQVSQEYESLGLDEISEEIRDDLLTEAGRALRQGRRSRLNVADRFTHLRTAYLTFQALTPSPLRGEGRGEGSAECAQAIRDLLAAIVEQGASLEDPELQRQYQGFALEGFPLIGDLDQAQGLWEQIRNSLVPSPPPSPRRGEEVEEEDVNATAQWLLQLANWAQSIATARADGSEGEADYTNFRAVLTDLENLGESAGRRTMELYGRFMRAVLDQEPGLETLYQELRDWRPEGETSEIYPAFFAETEDPDAPDSFQEMAAAIWERQRPFLAVARGTQTIQYLSLLLEGNYDQRLAQARDEGHPIEGLVRERDMLRRYLGVVTSLLSSGRATSTREAIELLPRELGQEDAAREFFRCLGRCFGYRSGQDTIREFFDGMDFSDDYTAPEIGQSFYVLRLIELEEIDDPNRRASETLSLARELVVQDSLHHRCDALIGTMLQAAEDSGERGYAPRPLFETLRSMMSEDATLDHWSDLYNRIADNNTLQEQIQAARDVTPYIQTMNQVVDSVFSVEGGLILLASIFTGGLAAEIAGSAMLARLGATAFTVVNGVTRLTWAARLTVGATRIAAAWVARSATELGGIASWRVLGGRRQMSPEEMRLRIITSFFCSVGDEFATHMTRAVLSRALRPVLGTSSRGLARTHAVTEVGEFLASGVGEMWGEDMGNRVAGGPRDTRPFLLRYFEETLHGSFFVLGTRAGQPIGEALLHRSPAQILLPVAQVPTLLPTVPSAMGMGTLPRRLWAAWRPRGNPPSTIETESPTPSEVLSESSPIPENVPPENPSAPESPPPFTPFELRAIRSRQARVSALLAIFGIDSGLLMWERLYLVMDSSFADRIEAIEDRFQAADFIILEQQIPPAVFDPFRLDLARELLNGGEISREELVARIEGIRRAYPYAHPVDSSGQIARWREERRQALDSKWREYRERHGNRSESIPPYARRIQLGEITRKISPEDRAITDGLLEFLEAVEPALQGIRDPLLQDRVGSEILQRRIEAKRRGEDYTINQAYRDIARLRRDAHDGGERGRVYQFPAPQRPLPPDRPDEGGGGRNGPGGTVVALLAAGAGAATLMSAEVAHASFLVSGGDGLSWGLCLSLGVAVAGVFSWLNDRMRRTGNRSTGVESKPVETSEDRPPTSRKGGAYREGGDARRLELEYPSLLERYWDQQFSESEKNRILEDYVTRLVSQKGPESFASSDLLRFLSKVAGNPLLAFEVYRDKEGAANEKSDLAHSYLRTLALRRYWALRGLHWAVNNFQGRPEAWAELSPHLRYQIEASLDFFVATRNPNLLEMEIALLGSLQGRLPAWHPERAHLAVLMSRLRGRKNSVRFGTWGHLGATVAAMVAGIAATLPIANPSLFADFPGELPPFLLGQEVLQWALRHPELLTHVIGAAAGLNFFQLYLMGRDIMRHGWNGYLFLQRSGQPEISLEEESEPEILIEISEEDSAEDSEEDSAEDSEEETAQNQTENEIAPPRTRVEVAEEMEELEIEIEEDLEEASASEPAKKRMVTTEGGGGNSGTLAALLAAGSGAAMALGASSAQAQEITDGSETGTLANTVSLVLLAGTFLGGLYYLWRNSASGRSHSLSQGIHDMGSPESSEQSRRDAWERVMEEAREDPENFDSEAVGALLLQIRQGRLPALQVYLELLEAENRWARELLRARDVKRCEQLLLRHAGNAEGMERLIRATLNARISASLIEVLARRLNHPLVFRQVRAGIVLGNLRCQIVLLRALREALPEQVETLENILHSLQGATKNYHAARVLRHIQHTEGISHWLETARARPGSGPKGPSGGAIAALLAGTAGAATLFGAEVAHASVGMADALGQGLPAWMFGVGIAGLGILSSVFFQKRTGNGKTAEGQVALSFNPEADALRTELGH